MELNDAFRLLFEDEEIPVPAGIFDDMHTILDFLRNADERFPDLLLS